jgi:hypothetical protein
VNLVVTIQRELSSYSSIRWNEQGQRHKLIAVNQNLDVRDRLFYQLAVAQKKPGWGPIGPYGHEMELRFVGAIVTPFNPTTIPIQIAHFLNW